MTTAESCFIVGSDSLVRWRKYQSMNQEYQSELFRRPEDLKNFGCQLDIYNRLLTVVSSQCGWILGRPTGSHVHGSALPVVSCHGRGDIIAVDAFIVGLSCRYIDASEEEMQGNSRA